MLKKVKPSSSNYRPHYVDEINDVVYISVNSFMGSISAPHWVKRHYPGFISKNVSPETLKKITTND